MHTDSSFCPMPEEQFLLYVVTIRWRHDALLKGLAARPAHDTPAVRAALALVHEVVEQRAPRFCQQLPDDTLLWADNRRALHGRATYTDPARHLIRIRIADLPNAERVGPSGISAD